MMTNIFYGCGKKGEETLSARQFLPDKIEGADLVRSSDIRIFAGQILWEYIAGGAEIYQQYNFIEVATANYKSGASELVADIYRFDNDIDAYGLYTIFRPEKLSLARIGTEGFTGPGSVIFVKGAYLVRLLGYEESETTNRALATLAGEIDKILPGDKKHPGAFSLFPDSSVIGSTDKYYSQAFLDYKFLPCFFSQKYLLDGDTVTLFFSSDQTGEKYLQWLESASAIKKAEPAPDSLSYDSAKVFIVDDYLYGRIIAGLKKGRLLGMVKYNETHKRFLANWLDSLQ
ncbi:MAG: hypothetical protein NTV06_03190 [candidate division Zixibacteria bacterium]|nr:hypothetical protein [candidate division Zixibacteria bacterium]